MLVVDVEEDFGIGGMEELGDVWVRCFGGIVIVDGRLRVSSVWW